MARLPQITKEEMPADQQHHYDAIAGSRGAVRGPFAMLLHSPEIAARIAHTGAYIRFENTLEPAMREFAIITVARHWDCHYEWTAHQVIAEEEGVRSEAIAAVRDRTAPAGLTDQESVVFNYVSELLATHRVSDAVFAKAMDTLGRQTTVDLTATAGYYSMIACALDAFEVRPEEDGRESLLPE